VTKKGVGKTCSLLGEWGKAYYWRKVLKKFYLEGGGDLQVVPNGTYREHYL